MVDTRLLYPPFRAAVEALLADLSPAFMLGCGYRGGYEQDQLYAQGRTKPGKIVTRARSGDSFHNYGLAGDLVHLVNGKADWTEAAFKQIGPVAAKHGLVWGGNWTSLKDLPHVEFDLKPLGLTLKDLKPILLRDGLPAVWKLLDLATAKG